MRNNWECISLTFAYKKIDKIVARFINLHKIFLIHYLSNLILNPFSYWRVKLSNTGYRKFMSISVHLNIIEESFSRV